MLLSCLLKAVGMPVKVATVCAFTRAVAKMSPWFVEGGQLEEQQWRRVRRQLRAAREPVEILRLWQLVEQTLQDPTESIGLLLDEGCELLEKVQEESRHDSQSSDCGSQWDRKQMDKGPCRDEPLDKTEENSVKDHPPSSAPLCSRGPSHLYPSLTRLANLSLEDEPPPRYHPLTLPKLAPRKKKKAIKTPLQIQGIGLKKASHRTVH